MLTSPGMNWNLIFTFAAAWLLTYAIHSTLLLGAVWGAGRRGILSPALQDTLWKVALVGGLLTAGWQTAGLGHAPLGGRLEVSAPVTASATAPVFMTVGQPGPGSHTAVFRPEALSADPGTSHARHPWEVWVLVLWGLGAAAGLLRLGWARFRLARLLGSRRPLETGPLRGTLDRLCREAGVRRPIRLSTSDRIAGPVALAGREICLPRRAVTGLDPEQQHNALAHELAHLLRRDPAWRWFSALIEHVFFFQPLNRVARRGLKDSAEFLCDDWAVTQTGQHLTLAKCLVEVAGWMDPRPEVVHAAGMAEPGSPLVRRVERLLETRRSREMPAVWRVAGATALLTMVLAVAPVVTAVHPRPEPVAMNDSFSWSGSGGVPVPAVPFRFSGTASSGNNTSAGNGDTPGFVSEPAPPSTLSEPGRAGSGSRFAPRAGHRITRRVDARSHRSVSRVAPIGVVGFLGEAQPAVVLNWDVPAAVVRAKLAFLGVALERSRVLQSDPLLAPQAQVDPALVRRLAEFLEQVDEAETLSLEVSTSLERLEPRLRVEAVDAAAQAHRLRIQFLVRELQELRKELPAPPPAPPAPDPIPTGSI